MSHLAVSAYEKKIFWSAVAMATALHLGVALMLIWGGSTESESRYKALAVMEFAHFDPDGGQPGGGESVEAAPEPAAVAAPPVEPEPVVKQELEPIAEPEPTPEPEPHVIESVSEKAVPAPAPPKAKPQEKSKPKPKPKKASADARKSDGQVQPSASNKEDPGAPGGGPGTGQGGLGGGTGKGNPNAFKAYTAAIQKKLNRHKKYPSAAKSRKLEGVVTVGFTVNRQGGVSNLRLVKSSGHAELDEEVMALVRRVSPFAPMPKEMNQASITITAPIQFSLR